MSIGDALAEGPPARPATITQVSQRTCIRETIIRGMSAATSPLRRRLLRPRPYPAASLAPRDKSEPLIENTTGHRRAPAISAADVSPVTPVKLKERRRPNWTAAMALALLVIAAFSPIQHFASHPAAARAGRRARTRARRPSRSDTSLLWLPTSTIPDAAYQADRHAELLVQLEGRGGRRVQRHGVCGNMMNWTEKHRVTMISASVRREGPRKRQEPGAAVHGQHGDTHPARGRVH